MMLLEKWIDFAKYIEMFKNELEVLNFNPDRALQMLGHMGIGMLVIFVIIGVIILSTVIIQKVFSK
ncbi:MAG: hypothetical protein J6V50_03500 [Clostridia bacterium]|nr:hypothetical protein [Clostridia bacterium]